MKNTMQDLNNILFEQLERLASAENTEEISTEIERSKAISSVADRVISNAEITLKACELKAEYAGTIDGLQPVLPAFLECKKDA